MCEKAIEEFVKSTYDGMLVNGNPFSILWDLLQIKFECCGFNKIENMGQTASSGLSLPKSCCKKVDDKSELVSLDGLSDGGGHGIFPFPPTSQVFWGHCGRPTGFSATLHENGGPDV